MKIIASIEIQQQVGAGGPTALFAPPARQRRPLRLAAATYLAIHGHCIFEAECVRDEHGC